MVRVECFENPFGRECRERLHRDAVIQTVREQVRNVNLVAVVCLEFRDEVDDFCVNRKLAFENVSQCKCRGRADLRERGDVKNRIFGGVQCDGVACAVREQVADNGLVKYIFCFCNL